MKDYDINIMCEKCYLSWTMTKDCSDEIYCPYCGKLQLPPSKEYLKLKETMENDLGTETAFCREYLEDYFYYWGQIDLLRDLDLITYKEGQTLYELKRKFHTNKKEKI